LQIVKGGSAADSNIELLEELKYLNFKNVSVAVTYIRNMQLALRMDGEQCCGPILTYFNFLPIWIMSEKKIHGSQQPMLIVICVNLNPHG
jgi:hypothetical protein